jgi:tetratricopeptide (TPR) repeat protein
MLSGANFKKHVKALLIVLCLVLFVESSIADQPASNAALERATRAFEKGRFEEAEEQARAAEMVGSRKPEIANLLGAIYTKQKRYDDAIAKFNQALALDEKFYPAKLNLAEAKLLEGKYADAQRDYQAIKELDPASEFVDFKLVLCYLLEGQDAKAKETVDTMKFPGETPAYYYARAAIALKGGEKVAADRYYENAKKYYADDQCAYFAQALKEIDLTSQPASITNPGSG